MLTIERLTKTNVKYLIRSTWKTLSQVHLIMKDTTYVLVNLSSPNTHIRRVSNEVKKSATSIYGIPQKKSYDLLKGESPPEGSYNKLDLLEKTLNYKVLCVNTCLLKC